MAKKAIVLMNLGSPDSYAVKDVRRYLNEFLMDERVIDVNKLARTILVKGIVVPFRAPRSAKAYKSIWWKEGSPLIVLSEQLRALVQAETGLPTYLAMRYGNPSPKACYDRIVAENPDIEEVSVVPLYPHYAMSSYETAVVYAVDEHKAGNYPFALHMVPAFYNDEAYLDALAQSIAPYTESGDYDKILFSYHGIPVRHVKKTDCTGEHCYKVKDCCHVPSAAHAVCYRHQTVVTTEEITQRLNLPKAKVEQTFQSRLGRDPWLEPFTAKRLEELPKEGVKKLLVVCPAFVSDCLETLEEMAEEGKETFEEAGGEHFTLIPCMNDHPAWVKALSALALREFEEVEVG